MATTDPRVVQGHLCDVERLIETASANDATSLLAAGGILVLARENPDYLKPSHHHSGWDDHPFVYCIAWPKSAGPCPV